MWLYGPLGVGKTAIAQSLAELCFDMNILAASFFFSRMAADCSHSTLVIATIAYQLCLSIPEVKSYIEAAVERDPDILRLSLEAQVQKLIIPSLSSEIPADELAIRQLHAKTYRN
jgi:cytidylate kinase